MFIQPCFIRKNTPELIDKLVKLGYNSPNEHTKHFPNILTYPLKFNDTWGIAGASDSDMVLARIYWENPPIDCGDNEELFLALAALRDDTDKNQWFLNGKGDWYLCLDNKFNEEVADWVSCASAENWHKATVEEIIEHFK